MEHFLFVGFIRNYSWIIPAFIFGASLYLVAAITRYINNQNWLNNPKKLGIVYEVNLKEARENAERYSRDLMQFQTENAILRNKLKQIRAALERNGGRTLND